MQLFIKQKMSVVGLIEIQAKSLTKPKNFFHLARQEKIVYTLS